MGCRGDVAVLGGRRAVFPDYVIDDCILPNYGIPDYRDPLTNLDDWRRANGLGHLCKRSTTRVSTGAEAEPLRVQQHRQRSAG